MTSRKTSAEFARRATGIQAETPEAALYPRSSAHFSKVFYDIFLRGYAPKGDNGLPIPAVGEIEGPDDWDLFTLHFKWRHRGVHTPAVEAAVRGFIEILENGDQLNCYKSLNEDGASIAFTHPDHALRTLHYLISETRMVSSTTMTTLMRNEFSTIPDCNEKLMTHIAGLYSDAHKKASPTLSSQQLGPMPMKPYASQSDAATQLYLTTKRLSDKFLLIDLNQIANDVAADCGRSLPHPHAAIH